MNLVAQSAQLPVDRIVQVRVPAWTLSRPPGIHLSRVRLQDQSSELPCHTERSPPGVETIRSPPGPASSQAS